MQVLTAADVGRRVKSKYIINGVDVSGPMWFEGVIKAVHSDNTATIVFEEEKDEEEVPMDFNGKPAIKFVESEAPSNEAPPTPLAPSQAMWTVLIH